MKLVAWLLEPLSDQDIGRVRKDLAQLRSGSNSEWAIAEVTERLLATTELIVAVDARMQGGKGKKDETLSGVFERATAPGDHSGNGVS